MNIKDRWVVSIVLSFGVPSSDAECLISKARALDLSAVAAEFEEILFIGKDTWELLLYSVLSTYAPPVLINGLPKRPNLHTNLCGEISSAKTAVIKIIESIAPKSTRVTKATAASLEGIARQGEFQPGLVELAHDGVIIIPEFKRETARFQLLREAMDNEKINLSKWGHTKIIDSNITFFVASNPKKDFFPAAGKMRDAIPFEEGILSRFDVLVPLLVDVEKSKDIVMKLDLLHGTPASSGLSEISGSLKTLMVGMKCIKRVQINNEQEKRIKDAYLRLNYQMGSRPLVILRDLESLCRLVNVIATVKFFEKGEENNQEIFASDEDVDRAIQLWEHLIYMRKQLYEVVADKKIKTIEEEIIATIRDAGGEAPLSDILDQMSNKKVCSQATFYRYLKKMEECGAIEREGKPAIIKLFI